MTLFYRNGFLKRAVTILIVLMVICPLGASLNTAPPVKAAEWAGWAAINTIYYDTAQDDATNHFLQTAADELQNYLGQMAGRLFTITHTYPPAPAIYLSVNTTMLSAHNDEASRLVIDNNGVTITGKTAIAVREGAYLFLDSLGVRWYMRSDIWTVVPDSLSDLDATDVINEPHYIWRRNWSTYTVDWGNLILWRQRNLLGGANSYLARHSYADFMPASLYSSYPDAYLPEGVAPSGHSGWQVKPDNAVVLSRAVSWALAYLADNPRNDYIDTVPRIVVPISPNDGWGWGSYLDEDNYTEEDLQNLTDLVRGLADDVAGDIAASYPNAYAGVYNYSLYAGVPSTNYDNNVYVEISTAYDVTNLDDKERITGEVSRGAIVGIYDFLDEYIWYRENPPTWALKVLNRIKEFGSYGATVYTFEGGDSQGAAGIVNWLAAKLEWNPNLSIDDLLDDFYTKAFGTAAEPMARYFNRWFDGMSPNDNSFTLAFRDLNEAEDLASGDNDVLARIRYIEYYMRFLWKVQNINTMSQAELEDLYTFVTKLRDLYILYYGSTNFAMDDGDREWISDELVERFPAAYPDDATVIARLSDYTPPTNEEAEAWLSEALTYFAGEEGYDATYVDPTEISLHALGDATTPDLTPTTKFRSITYLVKANANDIIQLSVEKDFGNQGIYYFETMEGDILDSFTITGDNNWHSASFTAPSTGIFKIVGNGGLDILNKPAGIIAVQSQAYTSYFYVPAGTPSILVTLYNSNNGTKLYDPNGNLAATIAARGYGGINNPTPGLWKLDFKGDSVSGSSYFRIFGVPDLTGYRPQYLLVEGTDAPVPPILNPIGNKSAHPGMLLQFTVSATDPNGDALIYSASNLPPWANFNAATHTFSGTPNQISDYPNVHFEVSDGTFTDSENIAITVTTNHAPVLSPVGNKSVTAGQLLTFAVSANDPDGDSLAYSVVYLPNGANFNVNTRIFSWTPAAGQAGNHQNILFSATDSGLTATETITITVNLAGGNPDINRDGIINFIDLVRATQHWGETGLNGWIAEDVNSDGKIDVLDVIAVGQHWTG
jgi:hypothetical protein